MKRCAQCGGKTGEVVFGMFDVDCFGRDYIQASQRTIARKEVCLSEEKECLVRRVKSDPIFFR